MEKIKDPLFYKIIRPIAKVIFIVLYRPKVIGIFPEGTFNRSNDPVLPFKIGAVKMAHDADSKIVPFVIKGKYKVFRKGLTIEFLKPISIKSDDLDKENNKLMKLISKELTNSEV